MGDLGGPQLFASSAQHTSPAFSILPHQLTSLDFLPRQNSFGFSPGTSPAANDTKNGGADSFFDTQNRSLPISQGGFLAPTDFRYPSSVNNTSYQPGSPQSVPHPSRLYIPSITTKQKHGQLTPPSEATPTKETPPAETLQESVISPAETEYGPTTRKRRGTQLSQVIETSSQPTTITTTTTPRRRKKSVRKQSSFGSIAEGDDVKRSQFLERNRVAASKCRQKKKEWTSNLEQRARELQASKVSLALLVSSLREELLYLRGEALRHTTCDCDSVREYLARHAEATLPRSQVEHAPFTNSGSNFSFEAMDLDASIMDESSASSIMTENQDLPELDFLGQIPD